jgi:GNAT superfamily N-acetyltransferase
MIDVRAATKADTPAVGNLMAELLRHYQLPLTGPSEMAAIIERQITEGRSLLAFDNGNLIGFAFYAMLFPGEGLSPQLYVKDVYTKSSERGRGVGRSLFQALAKEARARGCTRID